MIRNNDEGEMRRVHVAKGKSLERSEALLGRLPLHYGGQLHMWASSIWGAREVAYRYYLPTIFEIFWGEAPKNLIKIARLCDHLGTQQL